MAKYRSDGLQKKIRHDWKMPTMIFVTMVVRMQPVNTEMFSNTCVDRGQVDVMIS